MTGRQILCAAAGALATVLSLTTTLAGIYWLTGYLPPRPVAVGLALALAALGTAGGALVAHPGGDQVDPERQAFEAAVKRDLAALPVVHDRWWQPRRRKAGAR